METIPKENCCKIGFIRKNHGVHGAVIFEFNPSFGDSVEETSCFFLNIDGLLVPFFVAENGLRMKSAKTAFVSFDGVHTEKYARRLVGHSVYLFKADIIDVPDEPVSSDYRDYRLFDVKSGDVGIITDMEDFSGNRVMAVRSRGAEILIPFNEELLVSVDHKQKTLTVQLPDGMIESNF